MDISKELIKRVRESANLTTEAASRLVHCSRRAWELWESGERPLNITAAELFLRKVSGDYFRDEDPDYEGLVIVFAVDGNTRTPIDAVSGANYLGLYPKGPGIWAIQSLAIDRHGRANPHSMTFTEDGNRHVLEACERWERRRREDI